MFLRWNDMKENLSLGSVSRQSPVVESSYKFNYIWILDKQ